MRVFYALIAACFFAGTVWAQDQSEDDVDGFKRGYVVVCYYGALSKNRRRVGMLEVGGTEFLINGTAQTSTVTEIPLFYVESAVRENVHEACINAREQDPFDKAYKVRAAYAAGGLHSNTYYLLMFGKEGASDLYLSGLKHSYW